jgi:hypothetical protein
MDSRRGEVSARDPILEFDPVAHRYSVDGRTVPSVTQVIAPLYEWLSVPPHVLERKGRLGTAVHMATEFDDKGTLAESSVSDEVRGYLEAWRKFRRETKFLPTLIEHRVYNRERGYAGTIDRVGVFPSEPEAVAVIDVKSGAQSDAHGVQIAGYGLAYVAEKQLRTYPSRRAVYLSADGTYRLHRFTDPADHPTFLGLLSVSQWRAKHEH